MKQTRLKKLSEQSNQKTRICKACFKTIENEATLHNLMSKDVSICHDCLLELSPAFIEFKFEGIQCLNIFYYNQKVQEILYQFKGCNDYELRTIFLEYYKCYLNIKFNGYVMVPAPSFEEADEERGFNHVEEMFSVLNLKMEKCIHKTKKVKQADLTSEERKNIKDVLVIDDIDFSHKKVLIVDDVFTTGSTVKTMINLVAQKHPKKIKVLLMSKTIDLDRR